MKRYIVISMVIPWLIGGFADSQSLADYDSRHPLLAPDYMAFINDNQPSVTGRGYNELLASYILLDEGDELSPLSVAQVKILANRDPESVKGLVANYILVKAGEKIEHGNLERIAKVANGKPGWYLGSQRKLLATKIILDYQKNKAQ